MLMQLPNILTIGRLIAAPLVLVLIAVLPRPTADLAALILFTAAAVTDFFDGWLARKLNAQSPLGRMLDPIADKAIAATSLAALIGLYGPVASIALPVSVILLRETLVSGLREHMGGVALAVTKLAKWKTAAQFVAIAVLFSAAPLGAFGLEGLVAHLGILLLWIAAALTAITGWDYLSKSIAMNRDGEL